MTVEELFAPYAVSRTIFDSLVVAARSVGDWEMRATKSQVAFRRRRAFAWVWIPSMYLTGPRPPLVLSIALNRLDRSPRWKQVAEPSPGRFMHHLELRSGVEVDGEVVGWFGEAWGLAGEEPRGGGPA